MNEESPLAGVPLRSTRQRTWLDYCFKLVCVAVATASVIVLFGLLGSILAQGTPHLSWTLLTSGPEPIAAEAGMSSAIFGTLWVCLICALVTLPIGVATAILLEEYQPKNQIGRFFYGMVQLNISNLAGVPSVVYGILGLTAFVSMFGFFQSTDGKPRYEVGVKYFDQFFDGERSILIPVDSPNAPLTTLRPGIQGFDSNLNPLELYVFQPGESVPAMKSNQYAMSADSEPGRLTKRSWYYFSLPFGRGVLTGALTLMLVVLPVIIISTQESLRAVPSTLRAGALGLGATPWQVVWNVTLPAAIPGIMTGSILAMSRAIGETAPILIISGIVSISRSPQHLMDEFTVMPLQIYNWVSRANSEFHGIAAAGIILLLVILLSFNAIAVLIRHKLQKPLS